MKNKVKLNIGKYIAEIQDYKYKSRSPVSVRISGTNSNECNNILNEPCFFYKCVDAMSIKEGIEKAKEIIRNIK